MRIHSVSVETTCPRVSGLGKCSADKECCGFSEGRPRVCNQPFGGKDGNKFKKCCGTVTGDCNNNNGCCPGDGTTCENGKYFLPLDGFYVGMPVGSCCPGNACDFDTGMCAPCIPLGDTCDGRIGDLCCGFADGLAKCSNGNKICCAPVDAPCAEDIECCESNPCKGAGSNKKCCASVATRILLLARRIAIAAFRAVTSGIATLLRIYAVVPTFVKLVVTIQNVVPAGLVVRNFSDVCRRCRPSL
jgi:hypothetical protein